MSHFDFQQFRIYHDRCAMKVGTDGVLLGAWCPIGNAQHILDIGTGSGLIALMLAQRCEAQIVGVELDTEAALQAKENVLSSPFASRVKIVNSDIRDYTPSQLFDIVVSNPPFFTEGVIPPNQQRLQARHSQSLPYETLIDATYALLNPGGIFCVILPSDTAQSFINSSIVKHFTPIRFTAVQTTPNKSPKRMLLCFKKGIESVTLIKDTLILATSEGKRSAEYEKLTEGFYLKK